MNFKKKYRSPFLNMMLMSTFVMLVIYGHTDQVFQTPLVYDNPMSKFQEFSTPLSANLHSGSNTKNNLSTSYLIDTPFCKIPNISPLHPTIRRFIKMLEPAVCKHRSSIVYQSGLYLKVNHTALHLRSYNKIFKYCTYTPIFRPLFSPTHKNFFRFLNESKPFTFSTKVRHEFVRVNCYDKENRSVYTNFHAFVQPNMKLNRTFKDRFRMHMNENKLGRSLNVLLIIIDSVSRSSFIRQMAKTRSFLKNNLAAFDMLGYNKVADNTILNMLPLTLGKFLEEIPWNENKTFDEFNFIWKQYSKKGYHTLFAEDTPGISTFDYLKRGFNIPPCDHFYRPLSLAMSIEKGRRHRHSNCFKDRLEADIILNYTYDFIDTYKHNSHFLLTFLTAYTHDDTNGASTVDDRYYRFFKRLYDNNLIRNTVIFFFSDHGIRFGAIRETFVGKLEERLPFMYIILPKWLHNTYPTISNMLRINQHRLSTPFDVYETLRDILFFDGVLKPANFTTRGVSWFREISYHRSCETAGISPHWCTCLKQDKLQTTEIVSVNASLEVLNHIKTLLYGYDNICEELSINQIKEANRIYDPDEMVLSVIGKRNKQSRRQKSIKHVQVLIETVPGKAHFEATVRVNFSRPRVRYRLVGDISRTNLYGNQSACIDDSLLRKFCFCK